MDDIKRGLEGERKGSSDMFMQINRETDRQRADRDICIQKGR